MKVLMCHNYYRDRGGEDFVFEYETNLLQRKGYDVVLYCKHNKSINNFIKKVGVFLNFFFSFNTFKEVKKIIKKEKPDIAHIHNIFPLISPSIYFVLKRYKIPIIQTIHNFRFFCSNGLCLKGGKICTRCKINRFSNILNFCSNKKLYDFFLSVVIYLIRKFKIYDKLIYYYIAPSIFIRNKMIKCGIDKKKIIIKRNSLKKENFIKKDITKKVNGKYNYFTYAGRLSKEKGVMNLLKIFRKINNAELKILGDGPLKNEIKEYVYNNKLRKIELLGFVEGDQKIGILKKSLATIIPSIWFENCPLVLIESQMYGVPVIVNNIGALPEYITHGFNGFIYSGLEELEDIIKNIYSMEIDDYLKIRRNCLNSYNKFFDEEKNFRILDNIYKKIKK